MLEYAVQNKKFGNEQCSSDYIKLLVLVRWLWWPHSELVVQKLERKQQKLNGHVERLQRLRSCLTELRSERLQIETDLQRRTRLEETKDELTDSNETLDLEIQVASVVFFWSYLSPFRFGL